MKHALLLFFVFLVIINVHQLVRPLEAFLGIVRHHHHPSDMHCCSSGGRTGMFGRRRPHRWLEPVSSIGCRRQQQRWTTKLFVSSNGIVNNNNKQKKNIAILGGGLAGLSTAFHILDKVASKQQQEGTVVERLTVFDAADVGTGGASSVAGGLLHPLSPRGKLLPWGREGLEATNYLLRHACNNSDDNNIVLRDELYRLVTSEKQVEQFQQTSKDIAPDLCEWYPSLSEFLESKSHSSLLSWSDSNNQNNDTAAVLGVLRLHNGCKVIHVPSYLKGLWAACTNHNNNTVVVEWNKMSRRSRKNDKEYWKTLFDDYDTIVLCAGAGLFEEGGLLSSSEGGGGDNDNKDTTTNNKEKTPSFPIQLVRGQSLEVRCHYGDGDQQMQQQHDALLMGKYVSCLPDPSLLLVGATHEFQNDPYTPQLVVDDLRERTYDVCPRLWDAMEGDNKDNNTRYSVERITEGMRVQSQRGARGRLPVIGKVTPGDTGLAGVVRDLLIGEKKKNVYLFTGLSNRGLLYHGVYGDVLSSRILADDNDNNGFDATPLTTTTTILDAASIPLMTDWWRTTKKQK